MFYQLYEWNHAFLGPARVFNDAVRLYYKNPLNPLSHTELGRQIAAAGDVFERLTRRYGKPEFGIEATEVDGRRVLIGNVPLLDQFEVTSHFGAADAAR